MSEKPQVAFRRSQIMLLQNSLGYYFPLKAARLSIAV